MNHTNNAFHSHLQHTLKRPVQCQGIGLHSGKVVTLTVEPAPAGSGITFMRSDLPQSQTIRAQADFVSETRLGTSLKAADGTSVATIEHLMAAFWGLGVDNALVTLDAPEVPIMDGSAEPFIEMLNMVGLKSQNRARSIMKITEAVTVEMGSSKLEFLPHHTNGLKIEIAVDYNHPQIGKQSADYDFSENFFSDTLAEARTFGFVHEVEMLKQMGLARGGSLSNAIVLNETEVLNPEGLRSADEFVRHKALDLVGDLFLSGYRIHGLIRATKPGHQINTAMAATLLQQPQKWDLVEAKAYCAVPARSLRDHVATQAVVYA